MKERPILFSGSMVLAILDGCKSQTRRRMKWPKKALSDLSLLEYHFDPRNLVDGWRCWLFNPRNHEQGFYIDCPYGKPGDRLWVRETWQGPLLDSEEHEAHFHDHGPEAFKKPGFCAYRATDTLDAINADGNDLGWRPSIHMPRWASRILLEIASVRVERLHDISEADAKAEGCKVPAIIYPDEPRTSYIYAEQYRLLWESINGPGSWEANPLVWVIEFKRLEVPA